MPGLAPVNHKKNNAQAATLFASIFLISTCAITYELLISTLSSYLLGSSVLHFSLTIGIFMFFMGVGAYFSKFFENNLIICFIWTEIFVGLIGGFSALFLYLAYSFTDLYYVIAFLITASISSLVGLEIPIATRMLKEFAPLKETLAHVLSIDYLGALIASILFPLVLVPYLGIMKTSLCMGILNIGVAFVTWSIFKESQKKTTSLLLATIISGIFLLLGLYNSDKIVGSLENQVYQDEIVLSKESSYQKIVLTKYKEDFRLYLNGNLQFSTYDEHRYHEPLVHIPLSITPKLDNILVLGGGDGLAVREILKHKLVHTITVVDLDPEITKLATQHRDFLAVNENSLANQKVSILNQDAMAFLQNTNDLYNAIIIDLPDPNDLSLGKLYSVEFFHLVKKHLAADGVVVTQSSSPFFARKAFWCINHTLKKVFSNVLPYSSYIPSFGLWGFNLASNYEVKTETIELKVKGKFLTPKVLQTLFVFDIDTSEIETEINKLDNQILISYYENSLES
jgi:spermidine synthase